MYMREKVLGNKISCSFSKEWIHFVKEYLLSACLLNFVSISVTYLLFKHTGSMVNSLNEHMDFAFHYLLLSLALAAAEPVLENLIRYHFSFKNNKVPLDTISDIGMYIYTFIMLMMNFIRIFDNAFRGDEGYTIRLAKKTVSAMLKSTAGDVHPPLHYFMAQFLYHLLGDRGVTYHLTGFIPYAVIVIICCTVIKKQFGKIPAFVVLTMSSLLNSAVRYNVEARMYSLGALFILIAYIAFRNIIQENKLIHWVIFVIASLGAAYTHYYALISVAFFYAMIIPLAIKEKAYRKGLVISYIVTIIGYLPWLPVLLNSYTDTAGDWWLQQIPSLKKCVLFLLDYKWLVIVTCIILAVFFINQLELVKIDYSPKESLFDRIDLTAELPGKKVISGDMYWIITGLVSLAGTVAVGLGLSYLVRPFFVARYLFPLSSVLYLMIGFCVSKMKWPVFWGGLLIIAVLWFSIPAYIYTYRKEDNLNKQTEVLLSKVHPEEDALLVSNNSHLPWTLFEYYFPKNEHREYIKRLSDDKLDGSFENVWLFWTEELDESSEEIINAKQYSCDKVHEGYFANSKYYYVYKLSHR